MWGKILIAAIAFMFLYSCNQEQSDSLSFSEELELKSEVIVPGDSLMVQYPYGFHLDEKYLYVLAQSEGYWIQVRDKITGTLICRGARVGQGPGEVVFGRAMDYNKTDDTLDIFDTSQHKIVTYRFDEATATLTVVGEQSFSDFAGAIRRVWRLPEGRWLVSGQLSDRQTGRYILYDGQNYLDTFDDTVTDFDHLTDMLIETSSNIALSPDGKRMAVGTIYGGILEIFSIGESIQRPVVQRFFEPHVKVVNGNLQSEENNIFGFSDIQASEEGICAVMIGDTDPNKFDTICAFDWEGRAEKKYHADCLVFKLADSFSSEGALYAIAYSVEDGFYIVRLVAK